MLKNTRKEMRQLYFAYASGGYSLKEVGDYFDLHYSTVSGIVKSYNLKT